MGEGRIDETVTETAIVAVSTDTPAATVPTLATAPTTAPAGSIGTVPAVPSIVPTVAPPVVPPVTPAVTPAVTNLRVVRNTTGQPHPEIHELFRDGGILTRSGRQYRAGQYTLAMNAAECFTKNKCGMIEGATGLGKSFSYISSAVLAAARGSRTVIAVSTNGLLEQILMDIPRVCELMGIRVRFASMKGRTHYVCQHRVSQLNHVRQNGSTKSDRLSMSERADFYALLEWIAKGGKELTQYEMKPSDKIRRLVTINGEECKETRATHSCDFFGYADPDTGIRGKTTCNLYVAREAAMEAMIVVTNIDVLLWNQAYEGALIGDFDRIIIDEAHELNAKVRDYFSEERGMKVFADASNRLSDLVRASFPGPKQQLADYNHKAAMAYQLSEEMMLLSEKIHKGMEKFARDRQPENQKKGDDLEVLLYECKDTKEILADCQKLYDVAAKAYAVSLEMREAPTTDENRARSDVREHAEHLVNTMRLEIGNFANSVVVKTSDRQDADSRVFLRSVPIEVGGYMKRILYGIELPEAVAEPPETVPMDDTSAPIALPALPAPAAPALAIAAGSIVGTTITSTPVPPIAIPPIAAPSITATSITATPVVTTTQLHLPGMPPPVRAPTPIIAVSATLSPDGNWAHPRRQLAMPPDAVTCSVPSPFDYRSSAIWYTPAGMPEPHMREKFNEAASAHARRLVQIVGGRTLILCSARDDMRVAKAAIEGLGFKVYMQDEMPPKALARVFKEDVTSCLIGSKTFGTGFDAPGEALECVILWKLPFSKRTSVDELLMKKLTNPVWKNAYYVPAMLLDLRQWSGRLIRRHGDIGVISILDSGAIDGKYGRRVMGSMPRGINVTRNMADVEEFLKRVRGR